jgi:Holliday junction resolvasome RuvABC DNA-binding subunit
LKEKIGKFMERKERNAEENSSLLSSFSATENEHFSLFGFSTKYERKI